MELNQIRYFVALANCCNYSKAAEQLFIAQPTLSQQIKRLEEELNVQLFTRSTRKVALTPAGERCLEWAEEALNAIGKFEETAKEASTKKRFTILLGVLSVYPMTNVSDVIRDFQQDHPEIMLQLHFATSVELMDMLLRKKLDACIANFSSDALDQETLDRMNFDIFWEDKLHVVVGAGHHLYQRDKIAIEDILDEKLFFASKNSSVRLRLHQELRAKGYALPGCSECPSLSNMFNFIQGNMGISVMSHHVAQEYLLPGVRIIPIDPPLQTQTALIFLKENKSKAVQTFSAYFHINLDR